MPLIIENVVYQHAENACALWWQWHLAIQEPHYDYKDLQELENRVHANIDGLRLGGEYAFRVLHELADANDEGARFALALLLLEAGEHTQFLEFSDLQADSSANIAELSSALIWIDPKHLQHVARQLLESDQAHRIVLGLEACMAHARDPGLHFRRCLEHSDTTVRAAAYRTAANVGNVQLLASFPAVLADEPNECFEQARALALLGRTSEAKQALHQLATSSYDVASNATRLLLLMSDSSSGRVLLKQLDELQGRQRDVVRGFGLLGDPIAMNWLIKGCENPEIARLAGESISTITGVDIAYDDLDLDETPENFQAGPDDDPGNDDVALDEDENLPWPDSLLIAARWQSSSHQMDNGVQHLNGLKRSASTLKQVLHSGRQRQRTVAADLTALGQPGNFYCDTYLPTNRQNAWMRAGAR